MGRKTFKAPQSSDFTIQDDGKTIGHIRVKPSSIMWKDKSSQSYKKLTLSKFAELCEKHGTDADK